MLNATNSHVDDALAAAAALVVSATTRQIHFNGH